MSDEIQPRYIPVSRAFALMSVGRTKGYQLINQGLIVAKKLGRKTYIDRLSIERMFETLPEMIPLSRQRLLTPADLGLDDNQPAPPNRP